MPPPVERRAELDGDVLPRSIVPPWKPTRLRVATSMPALCALSEVRAGMAGAPVSSYDAASAQASAAFCSSVLLTYKLPAIEREPGEADQHRHRQARR